MRHLLLGGRLPANPTFSSGNSGLLGTVPFGLLHERDEVFDALGTKMTFATWVFRTGQPATKYVLTRLESTDARNYVEISIVAGNRVRVMIGEIGRATATFFSPIGSLPIDAFYRHVSVSMDMTQAQETRRVLISVDGVELLSSMVNPPAYLSTVSAISHNSKMYLLGTEDATTQLDGSAALAYVILGRALPHGYFVLGSGAALRTRPFPAAQGDGDVFFPLAFDLTDDFNEIALTLLE